jgi:hypothetical protein
LHMGSPNSSPSATRLWPVLYDLVDAYTRRGTIQLTVMRIALRNLYMCASLKTTSQKPCRKKGHGEKSTRTILNIHALTLEAFRLRCLDLQDFIFGLRPHLLLLKHGSSPLLIPRAFFSRTLFLRRSSSLRPLLLVSY